MRENKQIPNPEIIEYNMLNSSILPMIKQVQTVMSKPTSNPSKVLFGLIRGHNFFLPNNCPAIWQKASNKQTVKKVNNNNCLDNDLLKK